MITQRVLIDRQGKADIPDEVQRQLEYLAEPIDELNRRIVAARRQGLDVELTVGVLNTRDADEAPEPGRPAIKIYLEDHSVLCELSCTLCCNCQMVAYGIADLGEPQPVVSGLRTVLSFNNGEVQELYRHAI